MHSEGAAEKAEDSYTRRFDERCRYRDGSEDKKAFATELSGTTKIIIAQRISSVRDCDCIIVFGDGEIVGMGTHDEQMNGCDDYRDIVMSQSGVSDGEVRA